MIFNPLWPKWHWQRVCIQGEKHIWWDWALGCMSLDGEEQADGRVLIVTPCPQPDLVCSVCVSHSLSPTVHLICLSKLAMHGKLNFESSYTRAVPAPEYTCVRTTATKSVIQRTSHTQHCTNWSQIKKLLPTICSLMCQTPSFLLRTFVLLINSIAYFLAFNHYEGKSFITVFKFERFFRNVYSLMRDK